MYGVASVIVTATVLPLLGVLAVGLRFYVRIRLTRTFVGIDDWLIALSCFLVLGQGAAQIVGAVIGVLGRDGEPTVDWRAANQAEINYAVIIIEKFTYTCIKLSVLFFYRRIFAQRRSFRIANTILIVLITLWGLVFSLMQVALESQEVHRFLALDSQEWLLLWFAITDVLGDLAILTLPYPCIRRLQMSRRAKVGLTVIFLLGTLSCVFGIVRLFYVTQTFAIFFDPSKGHSAATPPTFWTTAEVSIGLLAACFPPLNPLIKRVPSPLKIYDSINHVLASRRLGRRETPERLSSVENIARIHGFNEGKTEAAKGAEYEMSDYGRIEVEQDVGISNAS